MFKHYLITRFNLRHKNWEVTKNNEALLTREWMSHRMSLFTNFCLPSVANQTCTDFQWLLFFDETTDKDFKEELEALLQPFKHFKSFYIDGMHAFHTSIKQCIAEDSKGADYIITSSVLLLSRLFVSLDFARRFYADGIIKKAALIEREIALKRSALSAKRFKFVTV